VTYPETRIILRRRGAGQATDLIVRHAGQPANYAHEDGTLWRWDYLEEWRMVGTARLRVYDLAVDPERS
jgi:hypothetical protein